MIGANPDRTEADARKFVLIYWFIMTLIIMGIFGAVAWATTSSETKMKTYEITTESAPPVIVVEQEEDTVVSVIHPIHKVRATFYNATVGQTDASPQRTATGFEIDLNDPYKHRIIAISSDLERLGYAMGDSVNICINNKDKALSYNGNYIIQDRMPSQHHMKIDLLVNTDMYMTYLKDVEIQKLN
jgi:3D (Asp-Asp-Asp) domain-containing protein